MRALASLLGLAVAIAAAVGLGSMMGGSDPRVPVAQDPVISTPDGEGGGSADASDDALDTLFGNGTTGNQTGGNTGTGGGQPGQTDPKDPIDDVDVELPGGGGGLVDPPSPIPVPVTTTLPDTGIEDVIADLTDDPPPESDLVGDLLDPVGGLVETVGTLLD